MEKFNFELTKDEVEQIINGMAQLPYIQVFELINNIQNQIVNQAQVAKGISDGYKLD